MKCVSLFLLTFILLLAACGRGGNEPEPERREPIVPQANDNPTPVQPAPGVPQNGGNIQNNPTLLTPEVRPGLEGLHIVWGFNPAMHGGDFNLAVNNSVETANARRGSIFAPSLLIQNALSNYFNVTLEGVHASSVYDTLESRWTPEMLEGIDRNPRTDIRLTQPVLPLAAGQSRTIPEDMIRRYAPNYAALLDRHNGWPVSRAANGEQFALNTFDIHHHDLDMFSVYRLEWLESFGIPLPGTGELTRLGDGIYFTPESYSFLEFLIIMDTFTREEPNPNTRAPQGWTGDAVDWARNRTWGIEVNRNGDIFQTVAPILGMFGVNTSIMEENGQAVPFFASNAYRDALRFIEDLADRDVIFVYGGSEQHTTFMCPFFRVGWAPVRTEDLYSVVHTTLRNDPARRLLITPPENGGFNQWGVGLMQSASPFNADGKAWVIGAHVSDDTLSRILNMFDEMSFDPELLALTAFGFHRDSPLYDAEQSRGFSFSDGERTVSGISRFTWAGEPFDSQVNFRRAVNYSLREGLFFTGILDGSNWQRRFLGEFDVVTRFAQSNAGQALNIPPSRGDVHNAFLAERAYLDERHWNALMGEFGLVSRYLTDILRRDLTVGESWDNYMETLNAHGLQEYIELFTQFPTLP
jgi:hypothetical protein